MTFNIRRDCSTNCATSTALKAGSHCAANLLRPATQPSPLQRSLQPVTSVNEAKYRFCFIAFSARPRETSTVLHRPRSTTATRPWTCTKKRALAATQTDRLKLRTGPRRPSRRPRRRIQILARKWRPLRTRMKFKALRLQRIRRKQSKGHFRQAA